ncbi:MAG TPA: iron-containing alcohol dehydrogenase [Candidatus Hydrogenedentes bacterium]|nr:iron-containing alcohol dehydrogenase [Candidatus Hydrogenedentota bacterium]HQH51875.1 iron-containing alcohol dehydrogenase [Candidatus Hydrogenedentota bacterium]HQM49370.1 iron-containing alcohol dehydrogenase [Candidatus Hydrogenedentota bacterium]
MAEFPEFSYLMPTEIRFGAGCFNELPKWCGHLGERPFVVTGKRSARAQGLLDRLQARLPGAVFYDKVDENPTTVQCDAASAVCREHRCDMVLAIGGGSPMDVAKAVAGLALNDGPCAKFVGSDLFARGALPIIAVPTTAGTGSEVTPYSVLVDTSENQKRTIKGRALFPRVALLDPELTTSLPAAITADTGLDALSQAMEGLVSKKSTALGNILALEACRLVSQWLPRAVHEPSNLEARGNMLVAAMLSGCVIAQSGTTLVHGMGYYYTLHCGVQHGLASGLLLAPVFRHNAVCLPEMVASIAEALGYPGPPGEAGGNVMRALHALFETCGVSSAARDAGVDENKLAGFAKDCCSDPYRFKNQPGGLSEEDVLRFYRESYAGI